MYTVHRRKGASTGANLIPISIALTITITITIAVAHPRRPCHHTNHIKFIDVTNPQTILKNEEEKKKRKKEKKRKEKKRKEKKRKKENPFFQSEVSGKRKMQGEKSHHRQKG